MKKVLSILILTLLLTNCEKKGVIEYPSKGEFGENLLDQDKTVYNKDIFSLAVKLSSDMKLKVKITDESSNQQFFPWWYDPFKNSNWDITDYTPRVQYFTTKTNETSADMSIEFREGKYLLKYYLNNSKDASFEKKITIE